MKPMRRRDVLWSLVGVAGAAQTLPAQELSPSATEELMRSYAIDPLPGEAAQVRAFLLTFRRRRRSDPRVEPAVRFEPEV